MSGGKPAPLRAVCVSPRAADAAPGDVAAILAAAARNTEGRGIAGALPADPRSFPRVLEGPPEAAEALFARTRCGPRHDSVTLIEARPAERRPPAHTPARHAGGDSRGGRGRGGI